MVVEKYLMESTMAALTILKMVRLSILVLACIKDILKSVSTETTVVYVYRKVYEDILPEKLEQPFLTIDIHKKIHRNSKYKIYNEIVILNLSGVSYLNRYLKVLEENGLWNMKSSFRRRYLIVLPSKKVSQLKDIFAYFFKLYIMDVIIMTYDLYGNVKMFTWDPYHPSNKCGTKFNIEKHSSCSLFKLSTNKEIQQFNKCTFTFVTRSSFEANRHSCRIAYVTWYILDEVNKNINATLTRKRGHYNSPYKVLWHFKDVYENKGRNDTLYMKIVNKTRIINWDEYMAALYNKTVLEYNSIFIKSDLLQEQVLNYNIKVRTISDDTLLADDQAVMGTSIGSYLIQPIRKIVSVFSEAGLIDFKVSEFNRGLKKFEYKYKDEINSNVNSSNPKVLSLTNMYPVFVFWGAGLTCATAVFIIEHICHAMNKRSNKHP
ncbi:hypothetical protein FQA39_LY19182 [Lamprigera yunnana]|nr:hypothetical protein FQA39_LY19182 [Lamprigera yunnana]